MALAIKAEDISKAYQIGEFSTGTISRDIHRWWSLRRGREDPYLKIGQTNDRTIKGESNIVWSLKDINFDIKEGDAVGIIGRNGAGKSTLLKILSKVTSPTTGGIKIKGRIASLLEVGTGFHPELTGRENIYLNGAILGMRKKEITQKFDEIVDFSGVERYIDTPVKRYSSGMYVRLAFAVAAHLESEILIVDEVLAVGDAEFQKKCLGKMGDISKGEGRTVLFVSHNMAAVKALCQKALILHQGRTSFHGEVSDGIKQYLNIQTSKRASQYLNSNLMNVTGCSEIKIQNAKGVSNDEFEVSDQIVVVVKYKLSKDVRAARVAMRVLDDTEKIIFTTEKEIKLFIVSDKEAVARITIPADKLVPGKYNITLALHTPNIEIHEMLHEVVSFEILETGSEFYMYAGTDYGCVFVPCTWEKEPVT